MAHHNLEGHVAAGHGHRLVARFGQPTANHLYKICIVVNY
jgi:hypothetical protein